MRWDGKRFWVVSGLALMAGSAAAQDDLFSVARRAETGPASTDASGHERRFTLYRNADPVRGETEGFGMYATTKGAAFDLTSPGERVDGPSGSLFSQSAGLGWRSRNMSAMVGYMKPSSVKSATHFEDEHTPVYRSRARFGLGWALHF